MKWMRMVVVLVAAWACADFKADGAANAPTAAPKGSAARMKGELVPEEPHYYQYEYKDDDSRDAPAKPVRRPASARLRTLDAEASNKKLDEWKSAKDVSITAGKSRGFHADGSLDDDEDRGGDVSQQRIARLERESSRLKERVFRSKARLQALDDNLLADEIVDGKDQDLDAFEDTDGEPDPAVIKKPPAAPLGDRFGEADMGRKNIEQSLESGEDVLVYRGPASKLVPDSPNSLSKQARIVPSFQNGVRRGFKLAGVKGGSLPSKLGLKSGDVLLSINGEAIDAPNRALGMMNRRTLSGRHDVTFEIERDGRRLGYTAFWRGDELRVRKGAAGQAAHASRWHIDDEAWLGRADLRSKPSAFLPRMFYFENTYLGRTAAFQERLRRLDSALGAHDFARTTLEPQRLDPPSDAGIAVTTALDRQHLDAPGRVILQVALQGSQRYGWRRPPLDLAVVLDPLALAHSAAESKRMLDRLVRQLGPKDRLGVILATNPPQVLVDVQAVRDARTALLNLDGQVRAAGMDLAAGMRIAGARLLSASEGQARVPGSQTLIVLTAGQGGPGAAAQVAHDLTVQGAVTSVVDLGGGWDWWAVANAGHGQLYSGRDVTAAVDGELERVSKVVARLLRVNIKLADGVEAIRVLGSRMLDDDEVKAVKAREVATDLQISKTMGVKADRGDDDDGIQTVIPFFHGGDAHVILVELWVDKSRRSMPVADVTLRYKDMVALKNATARSHVSLSSLPTDTTPSELLVRRNVRGFELAEALGRASVLVARGDDAGARRALDAAVAGSSRDRALVAALKGLLARSVDVSVKRAALAYAGQRRISHVAMPRR